ncbi:hypothetical protein [Allofournierella sp.]|uniref:hypothetical protein n=1 Tax=Allofournierella sp. TaxID=1940256 RepID=UPI003AB2BF24
MKRRMVLGAAILAAGLLLAGCKSEVPQLNTELLIYAGDSTKYDISEYTNVLSTFQKEHAAVKTSFYKLPTDETMEESAAQAALKTALAGGDGPDVIVDACWAQDLEKLAGSGVFYDMDRLLEKDASFTLDEGYQKAVIDRGVFDGKRVIMPLFFTVNTFGSTEELLAKSDFEGLHSYTAKEFCGHAKAFLQENPEMALFNNTGVQYRTIVQSLFTELDTETLQSDAFREVLEICLRNTERQKELGIDAEDLFRPYFALESGKYLFYGNNDNQVLKRLGTFQNLGRATYFTLKNEQGSLNGAIVYFAAINAQSENLQNAWDFVKLLLTNYQDIPRYLPQATKGTSMAGEVGQGVLLAGNRGIVDYFQLGRAQTLHYRNADGSVTKIPMTTVEQEVAEAFAEISAQVGEAYYTYSTDQVMSYFDAYVAGEKGYDACLEEAVGYVTIHQSE